MRIEEASFRPLWKVANYSNDFERECKVVIIGSKKKKKKLPFEEPQDDGR